VSVQRRRHFWFFSHKKFVGSRFDEENVLPLIASGDEPVAFLFCSLI